MQSWQPHTLTYLRKWTYVHNIRFLTHIMIVFLNQTKSFWCLNSGKLWSANLRHKILIALSFYATFQRQRQKQIAVHINGAKHVKTGGKGGSAG